MQETYEVSDLVTESLRSRKLRDEGGNTPLPPVDPPLPLPNSGADAISSNGDSEPTSSSEDSSGATPI